MKSKKNLKKYWIIIVLLLFCFVIFYFLIPKRVTYTCDDIKNEALKCWSLVSSPDFQEKSVTCFYVNQFIMPTDLFDYFRMQFQEKVYIDCTIGQLKNILSDDKFIFEPGMGCSDEDIIGDKEFYINFHEEYRFLVDRKTGKRKVLIHVRCYYK